MALRSGTLQKYTRGLCLKNPVKSRFLVSIKYVACTKNIFPFKWRLRIKVSSDGHYLMVPFLQLNTKKSINFQPPRTPASSDSKVIKTEASGSAAQETAQVTN